MSNQHILKKLSTLIINSNTNLLFILRIEQLTLSIKKFFFSQKNFEKYLLFIDCNTPEYTRLKSWTMQHAKTMNIVLDKTSCKLLCSYYENDLAGLHHVLYQLSIIYPNSSLNDIHIKNLISYTSPHFDITYFIDTILKGDNKRCNYLVQKLKIENIIKPLTILHNIQYIILLLVMFKRQLLYDNNLSITYLFNKYKIKNNRRILFSKALQRLNLKQLYQIITLLLQMEVIVYKEREKIIWHNFKLLIWLLCIENKNNIIHKKIV